MGYPTKSIKRRRHANLLRLHAACVLVGVRFSSWRIPAQTKGGKLYMIQGVEVYLPEKVLLWDQVPYFDTLASAVRWAADRMGIE